MLTILFSDKSPTEERFTNISKDFSEEINQSRETANEVIRKVRESQDRDTIYLNR